MNISPRGVHGGYFFLQHISKSGARIHFDAGLDERAAPRRQFLTSAWIGARPRRELSRNSLNENRVRAPKATPEWRSSGGGGSWSARIVEFANDLNESKRPSSAIGQKALVQVQNRYSRPAGVRAGPHQSPGGECDCSHPACVSRGPPTGAAAGGSAGRE